MTRFIILARGLNVGGKNPVPMARWRASLESMGYTDVVTYIASGNVLLESTESAARVKERVDEGLAAEFGIDDENVKVLVLSRTQLKGVIENKPAGFGEEPTLYHSDAIFLMGIAVADALPAFNPREGVDRVWPGKGVIYSRRLSAERTKSRLSTIVASPLYRSMTIRSWSTTQKLWELAKA